MFEIVWDNDLIWVPYVIHLWWNEKLNTLIITEMLVTENFNIKKLITEVYENTGVYWLKPFMPFSGVLYCAQNELKCIKCIS